MSLSSSLSKITNWLVPKETHAEKTTDYLARCVANGVWNECNSHFSRLPNDIKLYIFLLIPGRDLFRAANVCKHWREVLEQNLLWKKLFLRDSQQWSALGSAHDLQKWNYVSQSIWQYLWDDNSTENKDWKKAYVIQYRLNNRNNIASRFASKIRLDKQFELRNPFQKKVHRVLVFGEGLEGSSKNLLFTLLWSSNSPFQVTRAYPGIGGLGSAFGFKIGNKELSLAALYGISPDTFDTAQHFWKELFESSGGLVYVVDPTEPAAKIRKGLEIMDADWIPKDLPLLVLVIMAADRPKAMNILEVAEVLQINQRRAKKFLVRYCNHTDALQGWVDGFSWLSDNIFQ